MLEGLQQRSWRSHRLTWPDSHTVQLRTVATRGPRELEAKMPRRWWHLGKKHESEVSKASALIHLNRTQHRCYAIHNNSDGTGPGRSQGVETTSAVKAD
jgi:hypothetical protein